MTNKELDHFLFFNNDSTINAEHKLPVLFNEYTSCPDSCYYHYTSNFWVQYKPLKISQPREGIAGKPIGVNNGNWAIIPMLCLLIILARVNPFFDKTIAQYFNASVSNRFVDQLVREESAFFSPVSSLLLLFNLVVMALATPVLLQYFGLNLLSGSSTIIFFKALLLVLCYFFAKYTLIDVFGGLINQQKNITLYQFNLLLFTKISGLVLVFPLLFLLFSEGIYKDLGLYTFVGIAVLFFVFRLIKCLIIGWINERIPIYYIILYICAFEITPILIIGKTLLNRV